MRTRFFALLAAGGGIALLGVAFPTMATGAKPQDLNWYCAVTLLDRSGDLLRSDGRGTYTNGVDDLTCRINPNGTGALAQYLHFQPGFNSSRRIHFVGQTYGSVQYTSADVLQPDYFEVGDLRNATNVAQTYLRPFRVTKDAGYSVFRGDSFVSGTNYDSTSSVFVTPLSACSWNVEFKPNAPLVTVDAEGRAEPSSTWINPRLLVLYYLVKNHGGYDQVVQGYVPMPFLARVDVIANKPGCPL